MPTPIAKVKDLKLETVYQIVDVERKTSKTGKEYLLLNIKENMTDMPPFKCFATDKIAKAVETNPTAKIYFGKVKANTVKEGVQIPYEKMVLKIIPNENIIQNPNVAPVSANNP